MRKQRVRAEQSAGATAQVAEAAVESNIGEVVELRPKPQVEKSPEIPKLPVSYEAIVESIYSLDVNATYARISKAKELGDGKRTDRNSLNKALDELEDRQREAYRLYLDALYNFSKWEAEAEVITSSMRSDATRELQREKEAGIRSKQITDADVVSKMSALYPDEFASHQLRRVRYEGMLADLKREADLWSERGKTLQCMAGTLR